MQGCKGIAAGIVGMDVGAFGTSMLCPLRYSAASSPRRGEWPRSTSTLSASLAVVPRQPSGAGGGAEGTMSVTPRRSRRPRWGWPRC